MIEEKKDPVFVPGEFVVCIINSRANLTIGKEYEILDVYPYPSYESSSIKKIDYTLVIGNDLGEPVWYDHMRFIPKSEFRKHIINEILKK
jgi:hypothetical protein